MATTRIKDKISAIVSSQLPEYVRNDFPTFVAFLEIYYKFVEQDQNSQEIIQNLLSYNNIDFTTSAFIKYFLKNYASFLPENLLADKKLAIKKIKDLYESKGSTLSFQLFFKMLYNEDIRLEFPYENVLIPSDGTFQQRTSLRVKSLTGSRDGILDRSLFYTVQGQEFATPITEVVEINSTLSEVFLDRNRLAPSYDLNDVVSVKDADEAGNVIFTGNVESTTTGFEIIDPGTGFKKGQVYNINAKGGVGTLAFVSNVTPSKGIESLKFLNFGHDYSSDFTVDLNPANLVNDANVTRVLVDNTEGFLSHGNVVITVGSNAQTVTRTFGSNTTANATGTFTSTNTFAIVKFTLGSIARYPGEFTTNKGFLSDPDIRLQNDLLYQPYAYQTITGVDINTFKEIVLETIHPAGQRLFNNRELSDELDVTANVLIASESNVSLTFFDSVDTIDPVFGTAQGKDFSDTANVIDSGTITASFQTYFAEQYCVSQDATQANSYIAGGTEIFT